MDSEIQALEDIVSSKLLKMQEQIDELKEYKASKEASEKMQNESNSFFLTYIAFGLALIAVWFYIFSKDDGNKKAQPNTSVLARFINKQVARPLDIE